MPPMKPSTPPALSPQRQPWWQPRERHTLRVGRVDLSISFEPRDIWLGVFWDRRDGLTQIFVCFPLPCLPIRIAWQHG